MSVDYPYHPAAVYVAARLGTCPHSHDGPYGRVQPHVRLIDDVVLQAG